MRSARPQFSDESDLSPRLQTWLHQQLQAFTLCEPAKWSNDFVGDAWADASQRQLIGIVEDALNTALSKRSRGLIRMIYWSDFSNREVAQALDLSHDRVREIEAESLRKLRRHLAPILVQERVPPKLRYLRSKHWGGKKPPDCPDWLSPYFVKNESVSWHQ